MVRVYNTLFAITAPVITTKRGHAFKHPKPDKPIGGPLRNYAVPVSGSPPGGGGAVRGVRTRRTGTSVNGGDSWRTAVNKIPTEKTDFSDILLTTLRVMTQLLAMTQFDRSDGTMTPGNSTNAGDRVFRMEFR